MQRTRVLEPPLRGDVVPRLVVHVVPELPVRVDAHPDARLGQQRDIHEPIPEREDVLLRNGPAGREAPDDVPLQPRADRDPNVARETAGVVHELVAEDRIGLEEDHGGLGDFARAARDDGDPVPLRS